MKNVKPKIIIIYLLTGLIIIAGLGGYFYNQLLGLQANVNTEEITKLVQELEMHTITAISI